MLMCAMNLEVSACSAYKGKTGTVVVLMNLKCRFRRTEKVNHLVTTGNQCDCEWD